MKRPKYVVKPDEPDGRESLIFGTLVRLVMPNAIAIIAPGLVLISVPFGICLSAYWFLWGYWRQSAAWDKYARQMEEYHEFCERMKQYVSKT